MNNKGHKNNFTTTPLEPIFKEGLISFPLKIGQINQLEVSYWKWNLISIGLFIIISLILLSIFLQRFRLKMGLGYPELPP